MFSTPPNGHAASRRQRHPTGILITLGTLLAIEGLSRTVFRVPTPGAILLVPVAYAAFTGGRRAGLISATLMLLYLLYFFAVPGQLLHYTSDNLQALLVLAFVAAAMVTMVGSLKQRIAQLGHYTQLIVNSAGEGICGLDTQGTITLLNPAAATMCGWALEDLLGQPMGVLLNRPQPAGTPVAWAPIAAALQDRSSHAVATGVFWRKDGTSFPVEYIYSPIREQNKLVGAVVTFKDITARTQAEAALRQSEERFAKAFRTSPAALSITRLVDGCFIDVNESFQRMFGYRRDELIGQSSLALNLYANPDERVELVRQLLAQGAVHNYEMTTRAKSGDVRRVLFSIETIDLDGEACILAIIIDITERKRLEAQLLQAQKMESIGQLAGGIAHDFNNLLTAILGYIALARDALPVDHAAQCDLEEVRKAAQRAATLTHQVLAFARKQVMEPYVVNLNDLILDMDKLLRRLIREDIELVTRPVPNLGQIKVDPGQIEQVIVNLAVNACDAMPTGGKLTIETANVLLDQNYTQMHPSVIPGAYVLLAISDTGMGMDEAVKAHIFEPFFTTKEVGKGTGLGLATCYGIVRQHGGNIWVYSEVGHGTTVNIYLPRVEDPAETWRRHDDSMGAAQGTESILLVEDEPAVRTLAGRVLRAQGYTVLEAANGAEALEIAQAQRAAGIALLLTDMVMPQMSGRALAEQLQAVYPHIKVLFISGYATSAVAHHGRLDLRTRFLQKPLSPATVVRKVREILDTES